MPPLNDKMFPELRRLSRGEAEREPIRTVDETSGSPIIESSEDSITSAAFIGSSLTPRRLVIYFSACFMILVALVARAGYLDLLQGDRYRRQAEGNRLRVVAIPSERGVIHDRNGRLLARNIPDFTLTMTPADMPKEDRSRMELIVRLADIIGLTPVEIERTLSRYRPELATAVPIKEHLDYDKALLLDVQSGTMPGVELKVGTKREYLLKAPNREETVLSMSHVIGYEGRINEGEYAKLKARGYIPSDHLGKTGIEGSYESELRGEYGKKQVEVDALGREQTVLAEDDPVQGKDVTLTIDMELQAFAERSLKRSAALNGRGRGVAIAMDPKTGEILALVSLPAYDANDFAKGISNEKYAELAQNPSQPLYPRAIAGLYPPGSTIKLVVAAAALAEGVVTRDTSILSSGGIRIGQSFFPDWKFGGHGATNVIKAIAESVNTYFYTVGGGWERMEGLGISRLNEWFERFGLGDPLGVDLPGERSGFIPSEKWKNEIRNEPWYIGDTYHVSIGQGDLLVTPMQTLAWTAVFANGGDLIQPRAVKSIRSNVDIVNPPAVVIREQVVSPEIIDTVRRGLRQTVLSGSAQSLKASPWSMAGKTGTAQWRKGEPNHAWFTGFAPYDDPKIAVTVLVEAGGEGSRSAAPVARDIMETWLRLQDVKPDVRADISATSTGGVFLD